MRKVVKTAPGKVISKTILRNLVLLVTMLALLMVFSSRESLAGITAVIIGDLPCTDIALNSKASCYALAFCTYPGDSRTIIWNYLYNDKWCLYDLAFNTVFMHGEIGSGGLDAYTTSYALLDGRLLSIGESDSYCNSFIDTFWVIKVSDCPYSMPIYTFIPDPYFYPGPDLGGGCSYCRYNWMTDAQCHDAFDTVCPL